MNITVRRLWRSRIAAASVLAVGTLLLGSLVPASAVADDEVTDPATIAALLEQENHTMGSQVRKHEPVDPAMRDFDPSDVGATATVPGIDVASYQGNVNWATQWSNGKRFAYVKATEGTSYTNPYFAQQYNGSYNVGMIRGAYHFALPNNSSGAAQANYFVDHGGGWSADGKTLPGALDIEYNPYGATCYGLSDAAMVSWIRSFSDTYHSRTGRWPVIYTTTDWWSNCTGNQGDFSSTNPLWVARYASSVGTLPYNWGFHTFWQYTSTPLDQNTFNGAMDRLQVLAKG